MATVIADSHHNQRKTFHNGKRVKLQEDQKSQMYIRLIIELPNTLSTN